MAQPVQPDLAPCALLQLSNLPLRSFIQTPLVLEPLPPHAWAGASAILSEHHVLNSLCLSVRQGLSSHAPSKW